MILGAEKAGRVMRKGAEFFFFFKFFDAFEGESDVLILICYSGRIAEYLNSSFEIRFKDEEKSASLAVVQFARRNLKKSILGTIMAALTFASLRIP